MITIRLKGGLGNQLFQFAFGLSCSHHHNQKLVLDMSELRDHTAHPNRIEKLRLNCDFYSGSVFSRYNSESRWFRKMAPLLRGFNCETDLSNKDELVKNSRWKTSVGYFQDEMYFLKFREEIIDKIKPISCFSQYQLSVIDLIQDKPSISIHIRRGDYLTDPGAYNVHGVIEQSYYEHAIVSLLEKLNEKDTTIPNLFFFSDDILWCKSMFGHYSQSVFVESDLYCPEMDMAMMSMCDNNIIANSTFSWWAAWLNINPNKIVIAPKKWFSTGGKRSITPKGWIKI